MSNQQQNLKDEDSYDDIYQPGNETYYSLCMVRIRKMVRRNPISQLVHRNKSQNKTLGNVLIERHCVEQFKRFQVNNLNLMNILAGMPGFVRDKNIFKSKCL